MSAWRLAACTSLFVVAVVAFSAPASPDPNAPKSSVTCSFSNPGYSGWCRQNVDVPAGKSGRAACASVLACLNNTQCVAKTYCNATTVRGGWRLEKVERPAAPR